MREDEEIAFLKCRGLRRSRHPSGKCFPIISSNLTFFSRDVPRLPRSPYLSALNYILWRIQFLKEEVCSTWPNYFHWIEKKVMKSAAIAQICVLASQFWRKETTFLENYANRVSEIVLITSAMKRFNLNTEIEDTNIFLTSNIYLDMCLKAHIVYLLCLGRWFLFFWIVNLFYSYYRLFFEHFVGLKFLE